MKSEKQLLFIPCAKTALGTILVWMDIIKYVIYGLTAKILGRKQALRFYEFADKEFVVKTSYGKFLCRKGYNDIDAVRESTDTELLSLIRKLTRENDVFVDIGAHIGKYSVLAGNLGATVIALEPDGRNFRSLKENVKLNELKNVKLLKCAAYDRNAMVKLFLFGKNSVASSTKIKGKRYEIVKTVKLDGMVRKLKISQIDLLKVDAEGAEINVFRGAKESLKSGIIQKIAFESWKENYTSVEAYLRKFGYNHIKKISGDDYFAFK